MGHLAGRKPEALEKILLLPALYYLNSEKDLRLVTKSITKSDFST
jgi:hypothetical protein